MFTDPLVQALYLHCELLFSFYVLLFQFEQFGSFLVDSHIFFFQSSLMYLFHIGQTLYYRIFLLVNLYHFYFH